MSFTTWPWQHWAKQRGDETALILTGQRLSWGQLAEQVDALAGGFYQQGVREGDGVGLTGKNSPQLLLAWLALLQCGARLVPLNPQFPDPLLRQLLPGLSLSYAWAGAESTPLPGLRPLRLINAGKWQVPWQPQRLATLILTSGSSGLAKAAGHSCAAHLASASGVLSVIDYRPTDSWLLSLPLFHVSGVGILWRWLLAGARLVVKPALPLAQGLQGCTHASLVPTQLWRLLAQEQPMDSLREVLLGGAAIAPALTQAAGERGLTCWCGYGLTELASTVCVKRADNAPDIGSPLAGHKIKIVGGEIWLQSASLASGYWQQDRLVPITNAQGWFATRDGGRFVNNKLTLTGRLDNLFFSGGEGIQPEQVEQVIAGHPAIRSVFIVPQTDAEFGQLPVAVVEADPKVTFAGIDAWLADKLPRFQRPVRWVSIPEEYKRDGIKVSRQKLIHWINNAD